MDKLSERINAIAISQSTKEALIRIAEEEQIQIQQVCRKLLKAGIEVYDKKNSKYTTS